MGSFAQSLGGSQPATPLDLSYVTSSSRHIVGSTANPPELLDACEIEKLTIPMFLANFPLFRAHRCSHNLRTLGNRFGPMLVNEQPNTHQFRGSSSRRHHSPLLGLPKHRRILCSNRLNLHTMTCFPPERNLPIDLTISEMVGKGSVASSEPAASLKQATLTSSLLWAVMLLLSWLKIAEAP